MGFEQRIGRRPYQGRGDFGLDIGAVEPEVEGFPRHEHRHAVVERRERAVRRRGDDGGGVEFLAVRAGPGLVQAGESERR